MIIYLVGCKLDLEDIRKVPKRKAEEYAKSIDATCLTEVSAKTGENVKEVSMILMQLFEKLARSLNKKYMASQNFRELVNPVVNDESPMRAQSFSLENRFSQKRQS